MNLPRERDDRLISLLRLSEEGSPYEVPVKHLSSDGLEVVIVSDLHMSEGLTAGMTYEGTENFFADQSFQRLLHHLTGVRHPSQILVVNGDVIDFLRVVAIPKRDSEFIEWEQMLQAVGLQGWKREKLKESITPKEKEFGLKTHDFKSLWKLDRVIRGHRPVFDALAEWIYNGNPIVILKGNHDLEWYWRAVRDYLRLTLCHLMAGRHPEVSLADALTRVISRFTVADDTLLIDNEIYVEHGHRYDKFSTLVGDPLWNRDELNIPFGSFFNRYLINRIELIYPFVDNVRPRQNILHILIRERFFLGLKILFRYVPLTFRMVRKGYLKYMVKPLLGYALAIGVPVIVVLVAWGNTVSSWFTDQPGQHMGGILGTALDAVLGLLRDGFMLFFSYLLSRLVAYAQLAEPALVEPARKILAENPGYTLVTMGHTHTPESHEEHGRWYVNTGTWIPVVESSSAALREDKTYTLLRLTRDGTGKFIIHPLERWNDDAGRVEPLIIVERK
jgi:UDP-2,3-diacylglucosamine pyrophosphatase LpxH